MTAHIVGSAAIATAVLLALSRGPRVARGRAPTKLTRGLARHRSRPLRRGARAALVACALAAAVVVAGPVLLAVIALAIVIAPRVRAMRTQRRAEAAIATGYPELVELFVLTIGSGCSPLQAFSILAEVVPGALRPAVLEVTHRTATGERFADAIAHLRDPVPHGLGAVAQPLADALALADRHGTPLPPILDRLASQAREQRRRHADVAARQLPIRLAFPLVGCTLPSFVLLTIVPLMAGTFSSLRGLTP